MPVNCPVCKDHYLYVIQEFVHIYSVDAIGFSDVIPGEKVSGQTKMYLKCMNCSWQGWIEDYFEAQHGVVKLFPEVPEYESISEDPNEEA